MRTPQIGQLVWAQTLSGTYTVIAVDREQSLADLQSADEQHTVEKHVPFGQIRPIGGDARTNSRD